MRPPTRFMNGNLWSCFNGIRQFLKGCFTQKRRVCQYSPPCCYSHICTGRNYPCYYNKLYFCSVEQSTWWEMLMLVSGSQFPNPAISLSRISYERHPDPQPPLMSDPFSCFQHSSGFSMSSTTRWLLCCHVVSPQWPQSHPSLLSPVGLTSLCINISLLVGFSYLLLLWFQRSFISFISLLLSLIKSEIKCDHKTSHK